MTDPASIQRYYDGDPEYEYGRLSQSPIHKAEYQLTIDLIDKHIPTHCKVLDLGGGPGKYCEYLLGIKRCEVGLVDISGKSLELFRRKNQAKFKDQLLFVRQASATDIDWIPSESFDHILLMGPLYHLLEYQERSKVLRHCHRVLRPDGTVICGFISPFQKLVSLLSDNAQRLLRPEYAENLLRKGIVEVTHAGISVQQYRCWPSDAEKQISNNGFRVVHTRALEGFGSFHPGSDLASLDDEERTAKWFSLLRQQCDNRDTIGATLHFCIVGAREATG